jgi:thioredoxin-related protein
MKRTSVTIFTTLIFVLKLYSQNGGIQFVDNLSWAQVKEKAQRENKYIFVDVYATWCGPCKEMDKKIYPDESVGKLINEKFIAIKVQRDETKNDSPSIKSWYPDAKSIIQEYKVEGVPAFLFLSPDGHLMHRGLGYQDIPAFTEMVKTALTDPMERLHNQIADYKRGHKDYNTLPELIKNVREVGKDNQLATEIAQDYKENYLDKLSEKELLNKKHLDFIGENFNLINSKDKFFKLCYEQPEKVDKIKNYKPGGWADFQVIQTIGREEIEPRLWKDKKPLSEHPNWESIRSAISKKYPKVDTKNLILNTQVAYYGTVKNYRAFARYRNMQLKMNPPVPNSSITSDSWTLNTHAWMLFENSNDKEVLKTALSWSDLSIRLDSLGILKTGEMPNVQLYDTKANILYKIGHVDEAIAWETKAVEQGIINAKKRGEDKGDFYDDYTAIIEKMKKGEPTWPIQSNTNILQNNN